MPLDELTDEQLDRQLRELLSSSPRSHAWERTQRERLLHYITTGETELHPTGPDTTADGGDASVLELARSQGERSRPGRWWILTSAAAAVILVVGLVAAQRPDDAPVPAQQPISPRTIAPADSSAVDVPSLPSAAALRPDRFGVVTDAWPTAATATASWGGQVGWQNPTVAEALLARPDGDALRDGVALTVRSDTPSSDSFPGTPQHATVAGLDVEVYVEPGSHAITTVVLPGTPTVSVSGLDPVAFLEAAGGLPVVGERIDDDGEVTFAIDDLPAGYEAVVPPTRLPLGSVDASTRAADGDGADGILVWVQVRNPLIAYGQVGDLEQVDINGSVGWLRDRGRGSSVHWQVSNTTWASVAGASTVDDALSFARSIEFVDEATWTERYGVPESDFPTRDQSLGMDTAPPFTASGQPPATTEAEPPTIDPADESTAALTALRPSPEYSAAVWEAREIIIEACMAELGYDFEPRPNVAAETGGTWDAWNEWYAEQIVIQPGFESSLLGDVDQSVRGCQREAYLAVHGPGEEAYSKAATLENELLAFIDPTQSDQSAIDHWVADHAQDVERVQRELDEELQAAKDIIDQAGP